MVAFIEHFANTINRSSVFIEQQDEILHIAICKHETIKEIFTDH